MDITFLGTGAAQGVPPVFSRNAFFDEIRKNGGPEIRTRFSTRIGNNIQVDISPDCFTQLRDNQLSFYDTDHLFITHTHGDHFSVFSLIDSALMAAEISEDVSERVMDVVLSKPAHQWLFEQYLPSQSKFLNQQNMELALSQMKFIPLDYYSAIQLG